MTRLWVVARFEFLSNVKRWEFLLLTLGLPLFSLGIMALTSIPNMLYLQHKMNNTKPVGVGWMDPTGQFKFPATVTSDNPVSDKPAALDPLSVPAPTGPSRFDFTHYTDVEEGKRDLLASKIEFLYVLHGDYLKSGQIDEFTVNRGVFENTHVPPLRSLLQHQLIGDRLSPELLARVTDPIRSVRIVMTPDGKVMADPLQQEMSEFFLPYGMMILLLMSLLGSSSYLLRSLSEEKENRIMEILLAAINPGTLFYGKILGLGLLGLVQVVFWLLLTLPVVGVLVNYLHIPASAFGFFFIYFALGYMLFAGLIAGIGAIGNTEKESNQLLGMFFFLAILPMTMMPIILDDLNGTVARIFSFIPFTAPMVMMVRLIKETPPVWDVTLSLVLLVLGIMMTYKLALKVFRMGLLMYGKTPGFKEIWTWIRM